MDSKNLRRRKNNWLRLLVVGILCYGGVSLGNQFWQWQEINADAGAVQAEIEATRKVNEQLREEIKLLKTTDYIERVAREELGLVKAGEKVLLKATPGKVIPLEKKGVEDAKD